MVKKSLCGLTSGEIFDLIGSSGFTAAHAVSISNSIYKKRISDIAQIAKIPRLLKEELMNIAVSGIYLPLASEV